MLNDPTDLDGLRLLIFFSTSKVLTGERKRLWHNDSLRNFSNEISIMGIVLAIFEPLLELKNSC